VLLPLQFLPSPSPLALLPPPAAAPVDGAEEGEPRAPPGLFLLGWRRRLYLWLSTAAVVDPVLRKEVRALQSRELASRSLLRAGVVPAAPVLAAPADVDGKLPLRGLERFLLQLSTHPCAADAVGDRDGAGGDRLVPRWAFVLLLLLLLAPSAATGFGEAVEEEEGEGEVVDSAVPTAEA
jgi:hypothetical protein